jgi:hypothetical protein
MSDDQVQKQPKAKGTIRLTNDGIIRFHGEDDDGALVGYTGTYAPSLNGTLDQPGLLYADNLNELPGPHSFTGYAGAEELEIKFEDVNIIITARIDPHIANRVRVEGSGRGNRGLGR